MNRTGAVTENGKTYINIGGTRPDVLVLHCGGNKVVFRVCPLTDNGETWLRSNTPAEEWSGNTLLVPEKVIQKLSLAMHLAGLVLGGES